MRTAVIFVLFFFFLLIRSGNSHTVTIGSDRPAISSMYSQTVSDLKAKVAISNRQYLDSSAGKKMSRDDEFVYDEQDVERFHSLRHFHMQIACVAVLFCLYMVRVLLCKISTESPNTHLFAHLSSQKYISLRSLRI